MAFNGQKLTIPGFPDELVPVVSPTGGDPTSVATFVNGSQVMSGTSSGLAIAQIGPATAVSTPVTFAMSPYTVLSSDIVLMCATSGGAISVVLPTAASSTNRIVRVVDASGSASSNNITVTVSGGGNISGSASSVINVAYGSASYMSNGAAWYVVDRITAAAASSPLTLVSTTSFTNQNTFTISGLNGDAADVYFLEGQILFTGAVGTSSYIYMRPNSVSTNIASAANGYASSGAAIQTVSSNSWLLHPTTFNQPAQLQFNGYLGATSTMYADTYRSFAGTSVIYDPTAVRIVSSQIGGMWWAASAGNNLTSLAFAQSAGAVNMTGKVSVYRLSRT